MIKMKKLICSLVLTSGGLFITPLIPIKVNAVGLTFTPLSSNNPSPPIPPSPFVPPVVPRLPDGPVDYIPPSEPPSEPPSLPPDMPKPSPRPAPLPPLDTIPRPEPPPGPPILPPDPNAPMHVIVPEPITMFGTVTALGLGVLFKRKSSRKKKS